MSNFSLPNEKVILRHIPRNKGIAANVSTDHVVSGGMLINSVRRYVAPLQRNNVVKNVLTDDEKEYLENETGLNLSVYGDFWSDFSVALHKEDSANVFDLSVPMDYIAYKVLLSLTKVNIAPSWEERDRNLDYEFAITKEGEEVLSNKKAFSAKAEAFKHYGKIEDDRDLLIGILRLLTNRPISKDASLLWIQGEVGSIVDSDPKRYLSVVNNTSLHTRILINKGVEVGYIKRSGNKYITEDGLDLCNNGEIPTFENAVAYLDDDRNQDIRALIEAKINKN